MVAPKLRQACLVALLAGALLASVADLPASPTTRQLPSRASLLRQRASLASHTAQVRASLRQVKQRQAAVSHDLHVVEGRVRASRQALQVATVSLADTRQQLGEANRQLSAAKVRLAAHEAALAQRLRFIYEHGQTGYLAVLTRAATFADFADRYYLLGQIVRQDADILTQVRASRAAVGRHRELVAEREQQVSNWQSEVLHRHAAYNSSRLEKQRTLSQLAQERARYEQELAETEAARRRIDSIIRALSRTAGGRRRYLTPWRGSFGCPVPGARVTSGYGSRVHPIYHVRAFHHGVDLAAPVGTPIYAAGNGEVILATSGGTGYGRFIVIDHGGGVTTLYGHCSAFAVGVGAKVKKGQAIAYVGSTGSSTGPHCHFEVRRNGSTVPPM